MSDLSYHIKNVYFKKSRFSCMMLLCKEYKTYGINATRKQPFQGNVRPHMEQHVLSNTHIYFQIAN